MPHPRRFFPSLAALLAAGLVLVPPPGQPLISPAAAQGAHESLDGFAGEYAGNGLELKLKRDGDRLTGTLSVGGSEFPITARPAGDGLAGTFTSEGFDFDFRATLNDDELVLISDEQVHRLQRIKRRPANPLSGGGNTAPKNPLANPGAGEEPRLAEPPRADREFPRTIPHALGLTLRAPGDWTVESNMGSVVMVPPGAAAKPGGPDELYLLLYAHAGSARSVRDEALMQKVTAQIRESLPNLGRPGTPEYFQVQGRQSAILPMKGRGEDGRLFAGNLYITMHEGVAVGLLGIGEEEAVRRRQDLIRRMFEAISFDRPQREQRLVGRWSYGDSYSDPASGFSMATQTSVTLDPGGRFTHRSEVVGGNEGVTGSSGGEGDRGLWFADQNTIILLSESGQSSQVGYTLSGGRLITTDAQGQRQVWNR